MLYLIKKVSIKLSHLTELTTRIYMETRIIERALLAGRINANPYGEGKIARAVARDS
jgi:hypothetical protein